ncbi:MAG TPA: alanyl-tRNA editing protein, partial [Gemmatimonadales bacterium]|nr:alanyl-tRNA editing protein [Gemmatimonadales bacterium]
MTERLYYTDAYLREFEATVVEKAANGSRIYLDRTAFYPTSGGQPFDTGHLGGVEVVDVIDEGDRIAHVLAQPMTDTHPIGSIDWTRRHDHMQQHTGQHLLSAVMAEQLGCSTTAVHFGRDTSTIDLDIHEITGDQVLQVEERANSIVMENRAVSVSFESAEQATGLRKPSGRSGELRIITIQDLDRSACGGTHVRTTGEVGAILLRKLERVRKGVRVDFLCGARAVRQARKDFSILSHLASELSASTEEIPQLMARLRQELTETVAARRELEAAYDGYRARELYQGSQPNPAGIRRVLVREMAGTLDRLRGLGQAVTSLPKSIFIGTVTNPPTVILAASEDAGIDAGRVL